MRQGRDGDELSVVRPRRRIADEGRGLSVELSVELSGRLCQRLTTGSLCVTCGAGLCRAGSVVCMLAQD